MEKRRIAASSLLVAIAMMGTTTASEAAISNVNADYQSSTPAKSAPIVVLDENGMVLIAGHTANDVLSSAYGKDAHNPEFASLSINAYCPNKGCNTGNCVAGCGGSFA